jgi:hypothetical protein
MNMKRLLLSAAFALVMSTGAAMAALCGNGNCAIEKPTAPTLPQGCTNVDCARPEPAPPFQMARRR